jgi:ribosomal protein S4E
MAMDVIEIEKQTEYFRKMQKIEKSRKDAQLAR